MTMGIFLRKAAGELGRGARVRTARPREAKTQGQLTVTTGTC